MGGDADPAEIQRLACFVRDVLDNHFYRVYEGSY